MAAFLHFCLAQSSTRNGSVDDAIGRFGRQSPRSNPFALSVPGTGRNWECHVTLNGDGACVAKCQRQDAATESIERMVDWLQKSGPKIPDDPIPQAELQYCRTELIPAFGVRWT